jgi:hypothetical protein
MVDLGKVAFLGEHVVNFQAQSSQQSQNGDDGDETLDVMDDPVENMLRPTVPAFDFFNVGFDLGVVSLDLFVAHG